MAGVLVSVGVIGCAAVLCAGIAAAGSAAVFSQRLAGIADASALAAADGASGAISGFPCELAATIAAVSGAELTACDIDGLTATVTVSARFGHLPASASARAGPPP